MSSNLTREPARESARDPASEADLIVRQAQPEDAPLLVSIFLQSVLELGPRHYTLPQVLAWAAAVPSAKSLAQLLATTHFGWIAEQNGSKAGYATYERSGIVDHLYVAPDAAGSAVASELYQQLEEKAQAGGAKRLITNSSAGARGFFRRQDYKELERRSVTFGDVTLHNYAMLKRL